MDSLGQSIVFTGQQFFVAVQTSSQNALQPTLTDIPSNTTVIAVDTPVVYADDGGAVIGSLASIDPSGYCLFAASKLLGLGRYFNKTVSQFGVITNPGTFVDASGVYTAQFGTPSVGRKLFAQFKSVNSSGLTGPPVRVSALVTAAGSLAAPVVTSPAPGNVTVSVPLTGTYTVVVFQVPPSRSSRRRALPGCTACPHLVPPRQCRPAAGLRSHLRRQHLVPGLSSHHGHVDRVSQ